MHWISFLLQILIDFHLLPSSEREILQLLTSMSRSPDRSSDAGSDYNWPIDLNLEQIHQEQVLFENIAEEYVKGDDITVFFTIVNDGKINPDADRIGLTRVRNFVFLHLPWSVDHRSFRSAVRIWKNVCSLPPFKSPHRLAPVRFVMAQRHSPRHRCPTRKMNSINSVTSTRRTRVWAHR